MYSTNVTKKAIEPHDRHSLMVAERNLLRHITTGHGNMKQAAVQTGLTRETIYKAMSGMRVRPATANKIRSFILTTNPVPSSVHH